MLVSSADSPFDSRCGVCDGYRKRGKASPYVWSGTDKYKKGKYVGDGSYSANTVDAQAGTAAVLKAMEDKGYCVVDHGML